MSAYAKLCNIAETMVGSGAAKTRAQAIAKLAHDPDFADLFARVRKEGTTTPEPVRKAARPRINLAWDVITKCAGEIVDAGKAPTIQQAIAKVVKEQPDLYAWYRKNEAISGR